jgi:MFS family permease
VRRLLVAQASGAAAVGVFLSLAPSEIGELSGRAGWAGIPVAAWSLSAAAAALVAGRLSERLGRRAALAAGHGLVAASGVAGLVASAADSVLGLLASSVLLGAGLGGAQLGRAAVAEMHSAAARARALGILVAAGALGAVVGPQAASVAAGLAGAARADSGAAPWALLSLLGLAGLVVVASMRTDPLALALPATEGEAGSRRRPLRELLALAPLRAAVAAGALTQAAMTAVMTAAPLAGHGHDHGRHGTAIALLVSVHMAGMYGLAPLIGARLDARGRRPGLLAGPLLGATGALACALTGSLAVVALGLFLLGVGWSATHLGGGALVGDLARPGERGTAFGAADLAASLAGAAGAAGGGFLLPLGGAAAAGLLATGLLAAAAALALPLCEGAPGRWSRRSRVASRGPCPGPALAAQATAA